ncbi:fibrobacter succinogenes major paralogous domain-containing protein [Sphingobacterium corticibacter]|uniref:Fibrobacter succinogenes major paralogous domain-containing protein n=1 Tax=Sphingobacterium corticibacter TaxID=2171749 RepID=A0A2T8HFT1_9SPHI|nr:hypothetical protein [Sphingobacterium corticibacter]PVH24296.1 hypothetical protein DC487_14525 [Sphingobacterium corticibacter]
MKNYLPILICALLLSCKSENITDQSTGLVQVALADVVFESEQSIGNRAAIPDKPTRQRNTIELNKDFLMVAELRPEETAATSSLKDGSRAESDTTTLATNMRYRVLVYDQAGAFVTERDYIRGQEASTQALELDNATTYTFVAVSLGLTSAMPATTPAVATRTLTNSQIVVTGGTSALMYYQQTMTVNSGVTNRLDIVFKHKKPLITVTINSQQTGYNITSAAGNFRPHNSGMTVNLADGSHTPSGTNQNVTVAFNTVGSRNITNTSTNFINSVSNSATIFTISSITIGSITATNLVPFTDLTVSPGIRYNLIVNIVPNDQYITHMNVPSARINGEIWALHNLGVTNTLPHNPTTITSALHGNYYQFGRNIHTATGTATTTNSNFNSNAASSTNWNAGTESSPVKGVNDICPAGFRIPTRTEMQDLLDDTILTRKGSFNASNTNYGSAAVFTSRRNANVALALPAQGFMNVTTEGASTGIDNRGSRLNYWTSTVPQSRGPVRLLITNTTVELSAPDDAIFLASRTIRCIAM